MNPTFEETVFIPDAEAHVMPDGRLYVYGSVDISGDTEYCSNEYVTYSTDDMVNWKNHGTIFKTDGIEPKYNADHNLTVGGPDCIHYEGFYYLYYCLHGNGMAVAKADSPSGPFIHQNYMNKAHGDSIDPAVFVDDNGDAYYLWGQFGLKGAKLNSDMLSIDESTIKTDIITEREHGFHEGASLRKINGRYYLLYSDIYRGRPTCLSYAVADNPLGPYNKKGVVIDNIGSDPDVWNNHGSIEEFNGEYYIFYHRSSQNSIYNRRMCIEKITVNSDGSIDEVQMTSSGISKYILSYEKIEARRACRLKHKLPFDYSEPMRISPQGDQGEVICYTKDRDWAEFKYIKFDGSEKKVKISASCPKECRIEIIVEGGEKIGFVEVKNTGSWNTFEIFEGEIKSVIGTKKIWLKTFSANNSVGRLADISWFKFI